MPSKQTIVTLVAIVVVVITAVVIGYSQRQDDPFTRFNDKYFLRVNPLMKQSQFDYFKSRDPLIVVHGDKQVYFYKRAQEFEQHGFDDKVYDQTYSIETYDILKTFSHSTLYLYYRISLEIFDYAARSGLDVQNVTDHWLEIGEELQSDLESFLSDLSLLEQDLQRVNLCFPSSELEEQVKEQQRRVANGNREYIMRILERRSVQHAENEAFPKSMIDTLMKSAEMVVRVTLAGLDHVIEEWRQSVELSDEEYNRLRVIVIAGSSPRMNCMQSQFFRYILGQRRMGDRVIYAENMWDAKQALERLKTVMADQAAGKAFFGNIFRLQEDVLADAAYGYLHNNDMKGDFAEMVKKCPHLSNKRRSRH